MNIPLENIDHTWTLFLDRDGVINQEKKNDYVLHWDGFVFLEGVKDAIQQFAGLFGKIIIVTNQKCIGKGLLTTEGLNHIHTKMVQELETAGGRIDKIYYCPDLDENSPNRKPQHGMALQAKNDYPAIDFSKSIMVGNKLSDMAFARNAGIYAVFAATTNPEIPYPHPQIDLRVNNLKELASLLKKP